MTKQENPKESENTRLKFQKIPGNPKLRSLGNQRVQKPILYIKKEEEKDVSEKRENEDAGVADAGGLRRVNATNAGSETRVYNIGRTQTRVRASRRVNT